MKSIQTQILAYSFDHAYIFEGVLLDTLADMRAIDFCDDSRIVGNISRRRNCRLLDVTYKGEKTRLQSLGDIKKFLEGKTGKPTYLARLYK